MKKSRRPGRTRKEWKNRITNKEADREIRDAFGPWLMNEARLYYEHLTRRIARA